MSKNKEIIIASLRKQRYLLDDLISKIAEANEVNSHHRNSYDEITRSIESNLKKITQIKSS